MFATDQLPAWRSRAQTHPVPPPTPPLSTSSTTSGSMEFRQRLQSIPGISSLFQHSRSSKRSSPSTVVTQDTVVSQHTMMDSTAEEPPPSIQPDGTVRPILHPLYEELTETWQFVVACPTTRKAVMIDTHLDNNHSSTAISTIAADRALSLVREHGYMVQNILSTHEDPRHPSAAWYLRTQLQQTQGVAPHIAADRSMTALQRVLKRKYSMNDETTMKTDLGGMFIDGQVFKIGELRAQVLHLADGTFAFVIGDLIFTAVADLKYQLRHRHGFLIGNLRDYRLFTSYDNPPMRKARLMPVTKGDGSSSYSRKLVIRYPTE